MIGAKKFLYALAIASQTGGAESSPASVSNGGFEEALKLQSIFEWQITAGKNPRIGPNPDQKHSGEYSLLVSFGKGGREFRAISQTVAVEPGKTYQLELFYRSDVKTAAAFKWEIADATDEKAFAATTLLANNTEWTPIQAKFTVPENSDGVVIRLVRENCETSGCSVTGNLWFDDFRIRAQ